MVFLADIGFDKAGSSGLDFEDLLVFSVIYIMILLFGISRSIYHKKTLEIISQIFILAIGVIILFTYF